jgi:ABC-2 type transport system ATP-binding protein
MEKGAFCMELKTIGLTKKFGSKTAVDNLNFTLTNGVYGLLGANGAGKTTLMRLLCNIQNPTSGKILLNGKNIVGLGECYRNLLGYLPQHFGYCKLRHRPDSFAEQNGRGAERADTIAL